MIKLKRAYEDPADDDGERVLVERLWPRGITKDKARIDEWRKDVSPSPELRQWFSHDPAKWEEFKRRYWSELARNPVPVQELKRKASHGIVTFVYSAKDQEHNSALLLKEFLESSLQRGGD